MFSLKKPDIGRDEDGFPIGLSVYVIICVLAGVVAYFLLR